MLKFEKTNINPKNKKALDCVVRALSLASQKDYFQVVDELVEIYKKTGYIINEKKCYEKWLLQNGFEKMKQPRKQDNTKYEVRELDQVIDTYKYNIVVSLAGHLTCVTNNTIFDTWNCGRKTIGNYYIKAI